MLLLTFSFFELERRIGQRKIIDSLLAAGFCKTFFQSEYTGDSNFLNSFLTELPKVSPGMAAELESGLLQYELVTALQFLQNGKTLLQTVLQEKQEPSVS